MFVMLATIVLVGRLWAVPAIPTVPVKFFMVTSVQVDITARMVLLYPLIARPAPIRLFLATKCFLIVWIVSWVTIVLVDKPP